MERYYRGTGSSIIKTGIDIFDFKWVKEVQRDGENFLLFLETSKNNKGYFEPVGGQMV